MVPLYTPSPVRAQLSSALGSVSFSCWLILMVPQLVEQWRLKTVDGISPVFLLIWALGDVFNFVGAVWAGLLPEVILIALWFLVADIITLAFYVYIATVYDKKRHKHIDEHTPLINEESHDGNHQHQHYDEENPHHHHHHHNQRKSSLEDVVYEPENHSVFVRIVLPLVLVIASGIVGSLLSPNTTASTSESINNILAVATTEISEKGPQILGYLSAVLYLTARIPQIYHNHSKKSTNGLSLLFFLLTMLGNVTYSLQILVYRTEREYLLLNLSWLLGSLGTIAEDIIILTQFYLYRNN